VAVAAGGRGDFGRFRKAQYGFNKPGTIATSSQPNSPCVVRRAASRGSEFAGRIGAWAHVNARRGLAPTITVAG
jgi:hypothetical protein